MFSSKAKVSFHVFFLFLIFLIFSCKVRAFALACINHCGYKLHPLPLPSLSKILLMTVWTYHYICFTSVTHLWSRQSCMVTNVLLFVGCRGGIFLPRLWPRDLHQWKGGEIFKYKANHFCSPKGWVSDLLFFGVGALWEAVIYICYCLPNTSYMNDWGSPGTNWRI